MGLPLVQMIAGARFRTAPNLLIYRNLLGLQSQITNKNQVEYNKENRSGYH